MIDDLYQKTILEYSRDKKNKKEIDANFVERGHNPSCGDDITILVKEKDGLIEDVSFLGNGCAISTASTNILISLIKNKTLEEAKEIVDNYFEMMKREELLDKDYDNLGDATFLHIAHDMPARIKCATLSWHSAKYIFQKIEEKND